MSVEHIVRLMISLVAGLAFAWVVFSRYDPEIGSEGEEDGRQKYRPYAAGSLLPGVLLGLAAVAAILVGPGEAAHQTLSMCFGIFLQICLYYLLLLPALPLLRRQISARACALLWMIPNYLYLTHQASMKLPRPALVLRARGDWLWLLFALWLTGFLAVLLWKGIEHLRFRRRILKNAEPVRDPEVLALWQEMLEEARFRKVRFGLVTSPHVSSPLTVGLLRSCTRVVLPQRAYSPEEMTLILRHEIVHIGREDSWNKFFLLFCTAMCWFNPLMWLAMGKCAEDLELSCDETVLLGSDGVTRRNYADLLLSTAGDGRGFTTCLSASARTMRYRLKHVMGSAAKKSGALTVGAVFFLLCMTSGYVALAYDGVSGAEVICPEEGEYRVSSVLRLYDMGSSHYRCREEAAFLDYLAGLELSRLTGNYSFSGGRREYICILETADGPLGISLYDDAVKRSPLYGEKPRASWYYVPEGIDWDYLDTILEETPD